MSEEQRLRLFFEEMEQNYQMFLRGIARYLEPDRVIKGPVTVQFGDHTFVAEQDSIVDLSGTN